MSLRNRAANLGDLLDESEVVITESAKVLSIPKHEIYAGEQVRKTFVQERIDEMTASLESEGQIQPIIVSEHDGKGYCIQKGECRWRGAMGSDTITHLDCIVRSPGTVWGQIAENLIREDLNPFDLGNAIAQGKQNDNLDNNGVAKKLGISPAKVSAYLKAANAPELIQEAYHAGNIGDVDTINSLRIAHELDPNSVVELLIAPVSRSSAKALVKRLKTPSSTDTKPDNDPVQETKTDTAPAQNTDHASTTTLPERESNPVEVTDIDGESEQKEQLEQRKPRVPKPSDYADYQPSANSKPQTLRASVEGSEGVILFSQSVKPGQVVIALDLGGELTVDAQDVRILGYA